MLPASPLFAAASGGANIASYAPLLVPIATILTGWLAYLGVKRGRGIEDSQQQAKNKLDERAQSFTELTAINERLGAENNRLNAARETETARVRAEMERKETAHREAESRCQRQVESLLMQVESLRTVVITEVVKSAADQAIGQGRDHLASHDQSTPEGSV